MTRTLSTFSDAGVTTVKNIFNYDDTIYFEGDITASVATSTSTVSIKVYDVATDTLQNTPLDTTHSFPTNTVQSIKTDINATVAPSWDTAGEAGEKYYAILTVSGSDVDDTYDRVDFAIVDKPTITSPAISDSTVDFDTGVVITCTITDECDSAFVEFLDASGDAVYVCHFVLVDNGDSTWAATAHTMPLKIPVDTYSAGEVVIHAINETDAVTGSTSGDTDKTLALAVTSSDGLQTGTLAWLNQVVEIKYWDGTKDDYGRGAFSAWTNVAARIIRSTQKVIDPQGQEVISTAQTYVSGENDIDHNDRVRFGGADEAEIIKVDTIPNAKGSEVVKVIYT